jgi:hypothetical protein
MDKQRNQIYGVVLPVNLADRARIVAAMLGISRSRLMRILLVKYLGYFETHINRCVILSKKEVSIEDNPIMNDCSDDDSTVGSVGKPTNSGRATHR